ncbi:unnamed protein product [Fusarium langsethiae]|nr:unnamed protein product [Fusarium langsethiae]
MEDAEDNEHPFSELRYNIMDVPGRGQIYVEIDMNRWPSRTLLDSVNGFSTGIVILSSQARDELAVILVEPVGDVNGTMERFGIIKLVPDTVFFRPFTNSQRRWIETEKNEDSINDDDEDEGLDSLSDEKCKELGMPTWGEFMAHFWDSGQAKRQTIRLG